MKAKSTLDFLPGYNRKRMTRREDYDTSNEAADRVFTKLRPLQKRVLAALRKKPMTDRQLEALPEFEEYMYSTVRKRRSELFQDGLVEKAGRDPETRMTIWRAAR